MSHILIADDHPMVRAGLRELLKEDSAAHTVAEAGSGRETLTHLREASWDLLLLDINMPDRNGLDILRYVVGSYPETKVLMLSGFAERLYAVNVMRAGARGYLAKESAPEEMLAAVRTILSGRRYVSSDMLSVLAAGVESGDESKLAHSCLTEREFQVFYKLAMGRTVTSIGNELCLSIKTVSTYRSRILEKMRFSNNAEITTYAIKNALVQ